MFKFYSFQRENYVKFSKTYNFIFLKTCSFHNLTTLDLFKSCMLINHEKKNTSVKRVFKQVPLHKITIFVRGRLFFR